MSAWDDLNRNTIQLLITQIEFPYPQPDGVDLALKARRIEGDLRVVFIAPANFRSHARGLGAFLTCPITVAEVVDAVADAAAN